MTVDRHGFFATKIFDDWRVQIDETSVGFSDKRIFHFCLEECNIKDNKRILYSLIHFCVLVV